MAEEEMKNVRLKNVLCIPKLRCNLMSVPSTVKNGNEIVLNKKKSLCLKWRWRIDMWRKIERKHVHCEIPLKIEAEDEACFKIKENSYELWHKQLGHVNPEYLKMMLMKNMVRELEKIGRLRKNLWFMCKRKNDKLFT